MPPDVAGPVGADRAKTMVMPTGPETATVGIDQFKS